MKETEAKYATVKKELDHVVSETSFEDSLMSFIENSPSAPIDLTIKMHHSTISNAKLQMHQQL